MNSNIVAGQGRAGAHEGGACKLCAGNDVREADIARQAVTVRVWRFEDAPEEYRALSESPDNEEWLFHVPPGCIGRLECVPFLIRSAQSSLCARRVTQYEIPDGGRVYIGGWRQ